MARQRHHTPDVLEEVEGAADRLATWIGENALAVIVVTVVAIALAGAWGGWRSWSDSREDDASVALAETRAAYLEALGAPPGALEPPQLANPELARSIREQYLARFQAVADEHAGTVAGTLALFDVARIYEELGRAQEGDEVWTRALEQTAGNPGLQGLLEQRIALVHERRGEWRQAAEAHEQAGRIAEYPLRYWALVDAARCFAAAGDRDRALALYLEVEQQAPDLALPDHLRIQRRELRAAAEG